MAAGAAASCHKDGGEHLPRTRVSDTAVVTMEELDFVPSRITIDAGRTVLWKNTSPLVHTVTAVPELANNPAHVALPPGAEPFNSGNLKPGDRFAHTFTVPGEYRYFCIPHENAGMVGTVTVREDDDT
ncbi:MAG: halocyanin [Chitinivibrionales bacterium]|nr:halocyanin [Chitinivibrionales bacterium]